MVELDVIDKKRIVKYNDDLMKELISNLNRTGNINLRKQAILSNNIQKQFKKIPNFEEMITQLDEKQIIEIKKFLGLKQGYKFKRNNPLPYKQEI